MPVWSSRLAGAYHGVELRDLEESGEVSRFSHEAREVFDASGWGVWSDFWSLWPVAETGWGSGLSAVRDVVRGLRSTARAEELGVLVCELGVIPGEVSVGGAYR